MESHQSIDIIEMIDNYDLTFAPGNFEIIIKQIHCQRKSFCHQEFHSVGKAFCEVHGPKGHTQSGALGNAIWCT